MSRLTNTQKAIKSKDEITMIEAGFMTPDGRLTDEALGFMKFLTFNLFKDKILARAEEKLAEQKAQEEVEKPHKKTK